MKNFKQFTKDLENRKIFESEIGKKVEEIFVNSTSFNHLVESLENEMRMDWHFSDRTSNYFINLSNGLRVEYDPVFDLLLVFVLEDTGGVSTGPTMSMIFLVGFYVNDINLAENIIDDIENQVSYQDAYQFDFSNMANGYNVKFFEDQEKIPY